MAAPFPDGILRWAGDWSATTLYHYGDVVLASTNVSYACGVQSSLNQNPVPAPNAAWAPFPPSGGVSGVSSLNTQQGDLTISSANANLTVGGGPGNILLTANSNADQWSTFPAIQNVNVVDYQLGGFNSFIKFTGAAGDGNVYINSQFNQGAIFLDPYDVVQVGNAVDGNSLLWTDQIAPIGSNIGTPGQVLSSDGAKIQWTTPTSGVTTLNTQSGALAITSANTNIVVGSTGAGNIQLTAPTPVTTLNTLSGALTLAAGTGISISPAGSTLTIANTGPTITAFSYNLYVSNVTGSDLTGTGLISNPYKTIGTAMTAANAIADSNPVIICLAPGTYTENVSMTRDNVYIVGGSTSLSTATNIAGTVTVDMTGSAQTVIVGGLSSVQVTNIVYNNSVARNQSFVLTDCLIVPGLGVSALVATDTSIGGNGDMTIQNSLIYMSDAVAVTCSNCSLNFINTQITNNPVVISPLSMITTTGSGRVSLFGCSVIQGSTVSTVAPLVSLGNTASSQVITISNSILQYTSATADTGTGAKCCIRMANSSPITSVSVYNCLLICEGARTTNGILTQYLAIQRTGAGTVTLNYGQNLCGATANHLPAAAVGLTKTPYIVLGN